MTAVDVDTTAEDAAWWAMDAGCSSRRVCNRAAEWWMRKGCGCSRLLCDDHRRRLERGRADALAMGLSRITCPACKRNRPLCDDVEWRPL